MSKKTSGKTWFYALGQRAYAVGNARYPPDSLARWAFRSWLTGWEDSYWSRPL